MVCVCVLGQGEGQWLFSPTVWPVSLFIALGKYELFYGHFSFSSVQRYSLTNRLQSQRSIAVLLINLYSIFRSLSYVSRSTVF